MNKTKIDWQNPKEGWKLDCTWNPVIGCKNNCWYCYAKKINDRFKFIDRFDMPSFIMKRLPEPLEIKRPKTIFVNSMSDIEWWEDKWMNDVIDICKKTPQHRYLFLTKQPAEYNFYDFPDNCWFGCTVTDKITYDFAIEEMFKLKNKKFISFEPVLGDIGNIKVPSIIDWVIIGALTNNRLPVSITEYCDWLKSVWHYNAWYKFSVAKMFKKRG